MLSFALTVVAFASALHGQIESAAVGVSVVSLEPGSKDGPQLTFAAPQYLCDIKHQAVSTGLGSNTLVDTAASWSNDLYNGVNGPHYLEVVQIGGSVAVPGVGIRREIVDTVEGTQTLILNEPWPSGVVSPIHYRIVKHWTIKELFGTEMLVGIASSISGTTLIDATANWSANQFNGENGAHFVEIVKIDDSTTAVGVGTRREIVNTDNVTRSLTVDEAWPTFGGVVAYRIMRHTAVRSNTSGNLRSGTTVTADSFQLWDGESYETFYYQTSGIGGIGWRKAGDQFTDASNTIIKPGQAIIFTRGETVPLNLVVRGVVKDGRTPLEVKPGFNFLSNPYASAMTLASCALHTGNENTGLVAGSLVTADQVMVWNGVFYDTYYYQSSNFGGIGWRKVGDLTTNASATVIPPGTSIIIRRLAPTAFIWDVPAHPVAQ